MTAISMRPVRASSTSGMPGKDAPDDWGSTRSETVAPTQFARDENDYLAGPKDVGQIGRHVAGDQHELFVSCDPAEAVQQQLEHLRPEYIALHDLGTASTRKLLAGVAAASQRALQKLMIRRQGFGTPLATLEFLDLPTGDGRSLRVYTTEVDADTATRHQLSRVLLAYSRLGVVMVGDLPAHLLKSSLEPLRDAMIAGPWPNRELLMLPLASAATLAHEAPALANGTGVQVRTTPQVTRPADAWSFISGAFNKLREQAAPAAAPVQPTPAPAPPASSSSARMTPMPPLRRQGTPVVESTLGRYVRLLADLPGVVSCCVFEIAGGRPLVHAGARPGPEELATQGASLLAALGGTSRALGFSHALPEAAITVGNHHLLLRGVPKHPGVALHAVLDMHHANPTLARLQIGRHDALFDEPSS
ncbi:hypothetical protein [Rhizobacter sp. LjRoot28]|uniref:hypothetical protein n=1 Tax=Rhizobacter sp. LjRoot28 TaxID=3342309 RepID=UPI003ED00FCD